MNRYIVPIISLTVVIVLIVFGAVLGSINRKTSKQSEDVKVEVTHAPKRERETKERGRSSGIYQTSSSNKELTAEEVAKNEISIVEVRSGNSMGSGIIISSDGYVLTNNHVIEGYDECDVVFSNKNDEVVKSLEAQVVLFDEGRDLALLKIIDRDEYDYAYLYQGAISKGQNVIAIGNPLGLTKTVTRGIVSSTRNANGVELIQFDATITSGSSGGALFNMSGEVIGITTAGYESKDLNFAVSSNEIIKFLNEYRE